MRDFLRSRFARVWLPVLTAAAGLATLDRGTDTGDLLYFVHRGEQLLSGRWADTFADPMLQSGPLQLVLVGSVHNVTALAFVIAFAVVGLLLFVLGRLGVSDGVRLAVGLVGLAAGLTQNAFAYGHPAQPIIPLLWVLAGLSARKNRPVEAGALVGFSAGFELWGVLGLPVLLLVPRFQRAVAAVAVEAVVVAGLLVPFVIAGTFRMFEYEWEVSTSSLIGLVVEPGTGFGWPLRLLQAGLAVMGGAAVALFLRKSIHCVWLAPLVVLIVRLLLDPQSYGWYWIAPLALVLVGAALVLMELPTRFPATRLGRAAGPRHPTAVQPPTRS
jgi:hypothetical protein